MIMERRNSCTANANVEYPGYTSKLQCGFLLFDTDRGPSITDLGDSNGSKWHSKSFHVCRRTVTATRGILSFKLGSLTQLMNQLRDKDACVLRRSIAEGRKLVFKLPGQTR